MNKIHKIEITPKTIITIAVLLGSMWLLIKLSSVVFLIFTAFSISALLSPVVDYLHSRKIPRNIAIAIIYLLFFSTLTLFLLLIYRPFIKQFQSFILALPELVTGVINFVIQGFPWLKESFNWDAILTNVQDSFWQSSGLIDIIADIPKYTIGIIGSFFTILISIFSVVVLSIYFIQGKELSKEKFIQLLPKHYRKRITTLLDNIERQLGAWLRGQILLMLIIGILSWLGLEIVGIDFSLPLGVIGGLLETIPNIGPMITIVLALIVAVGSEASAWQVIFVAVWFILIQQFENYVIVPKLMQRVVGTNPILTMIAVLGGSRLFGIGGALLAVPIAAIVQISLRYYLEYKAEGK